MNFCNRYRVRTKVVWYNPISWLVWCWETLTDSSKEPSGHSILTALFFVSMLFGYWLVYILFLGWYGYLFKPKSYIIRAGDIMADLNSEKDTSGRWWERTECRAASQAAIACNPDDVVCFSWRPHPIFLDGEIMYVWSPRFKARVWKSVITYTGNTQRFE